MKRGIAYFITPHGYGHAARASAMMRAIYERAPDSFFDLFTQVPLWFFEMSIPGIFRYHTLKSDIGLVQTSSMVEDLPETIHQLNQLLPFRDEVVLPLAQQVRDLGCSLVVCDIAPLGIEVARAAGLPSVLVENFTWDWIYEGYLAEEPRFTPHIRYLSHTFRAADWHIRTEPACAEDIPADLVSGVVSRKLRASRNEVREHLDIPENAHLVMITMGGILTEYPFLDQLETSKELYFLVPGGSDQYEKRGSLVLVPHHSHYFHPDLVGASDVIVGKLGYSTLAEAYAAGVPYIFIPRMKFREGPPMGKFAQEVMGAVSLPEERFFNGGWLDVIPGLLERGLKPPPGPNGADQAAEFILSCITGEPPP